MPDTSNNVDIDVTPQIDENNAQNQTPANKVDLVAVGIRTAFITIIAIVLLFGCFLSFFPYTAMKFYDKIGNKEMALGYAEKYMNINRSDEQPSAFGKYADALYYATNTSAYFMNRYNDTEGTAGENATYFAKKAYKYADEYLGYNSLNERTEKIDSYNLSHAMPVARPQVYSYSDYLNTMRFKAEYILYRNALNGGDTATAEEYRVKMLGPIQGVITGWGEGETDGFNLNESQYDAAFLMFSQLTVYINGELHELGLKSKMQEAEHGVIILKSDTDNGIIGKVRNSFELLLQPDAPDSPQSDSPFTRDYKSITDRYNEFIKRLRDNCTKYIVNSAEQNAPTMHLKNTADLKSLSDFAVAMQNMTSVLSANANHYDDKYEQSLKQSNEDWLNNLFVQDVRMRDHRNQIDNHANGYIYDWYEYGYLADYLDYFRK